MRKYNHKPAYCTHLRVKSCEECSLVNYGRDCYNNPISRHSRQREDIMLAIMPANQEMIKRLVEFGQRMADRGTPEVFVDVWNCRARIMALRNGKYVDVTEEIPNGEELAEEAVYAFGGAINISGWYPPTEEIIEAFRGTQGS